MKRPDTTQIISHILFNYHILNWVNQIYCLRVCDDRRHSSDMVLLGSYASDEAAPQDVSLMYSVGVLSALTCLGLL